MKRVRLRTIIILLLSLCLIATFFVSSDVGAQDGEVRRAAWYQTEYGTGPLGQTWMIGRFGPDVGIGEEGFRYEFRDPSTGVYVSYQSTGLGVGLCCPFAGYGGRYSSLGAISYGPYALGQEPQVQPTVGWTTRGAISGGLFQPQQSYYQAQPSILGLLFGGLGGLGGFGGYDSLGGFGGFGGLGGYGGLFGVAASGTGSGPLPTIIY